MSQVTPSGFSPWQLFQLQQSMESQVSQTPPLSSSFPSWDAVFDLANRVKYFALAAIGLYVLYRVCTSLKTPPTTTTVTKKSTSDQYVVAFSSKFSNKYISELTSEGYNGFAEVKDADWNKLVEEQDYVEILKIVWTEKDLDVVISRLEPEAKKGHAILMLELSRTLYRKANGKETFPFPEELKAAQNWNMQGICIARLDIACTSSITTEHTIRNLQDAYDRRKYIPQHLCLDVDYVSFIRNWQSWWKPLEPYPSPKWVTNQDMGDFEKISLLPEDEWNKKRAEKFQELINDAS
jgi:hypothetical protein